MRGGKLEGNKIQWRQAKKIGALHPRWRCAFAGNCGQKEHAKGCGHQGTASFGRHPPPAAGRRCVRRRRAGRAGKLLRRSAHRCTGWRVPAAGAARSRDLRPSPQCLRASGVPAPCLQARGFLARLSILRRMSMCLRSAVFFQRSVGKSTCTDFKIVRCALKWCLFWGITPTGARVTVLDLQLTFMPCPAVYVLCKRRTSSTNYHEAALHTYRVSTTILFIRAQPSSTIVEAGTDLLHVPISRALMMLQAYSVSLYSPICLRHFINIHRDNLILES